MFWGITSNEQVPIVVFSFMRLQSHLLLATLTESAKLSTEISNFFMISHRESDKQTCIRLCNGNSEALSWIQLGRLYVHEIDDLVDEDLTKQQKAEKACTIGALAVDLFSHPFYLKNMAVLRSHMLLNTSNYLDSVNCEGKQGWESELSDWMRHGFVDIVLVVAEICGGYANMRNESMELRTMSYMAHHDGKKAI